MMRAFVMLGLSGCMVGGGPVVGIGQRGFVYGAEASGGLTFANATLGYQSEGQVGYAALGFDSPLDHGGAPQFDGNLHPYGRVALGLGITSRQRPDGYQDIDVHGMVLGGGGGVASSKRLDNCGNSNVPTVAVTLEVRYLTQWEVVLVSRLLGVQVPCLG